LTFTCQWRGAFESTEVSLLHADAFGSSVDTDGAANSKGAAHTKGAANTETEIDWRSNVGTHSLGWVTGRDGDQRLIGFVNVIWDGGAHAWIQDVMVSSPSRNRGIGTQLVAAARHAAAQAGCQWLHVDFEEGLGPFYLDACGFVPTTAGLMHLASP
jgi:GNAT superfamily N-acetyltransferase